MSVKKSVKPRHPLVSEQQQNQEVKDRMILNEQIEVLEAKHAARNMII